MFRGEITMVKPHETSPAKRWELQAKDHQLSRACLVRKPRFYLGAAGKNVAFTGDV